MESTMERMTDFFVARIDDYDRHMLEDVDGCEEAYKEVAKLIPRHTHDLLDLGCGTGLELEEIFKLFPDVRVTGIDLTKEMLDRLEKKYPGKQLGLVHGDYFSVPLGFSRYDAAVSFYSLHHFQHDAKVRLYSKVLSSLRASGRYIECDCMGTSQEEEDLFFAESRRIRAELGIPMNALYHFDTPCTVENQMKMLLQAGFASAEMVFRQEYTTILVAQK